MRRKIGAWMCRRGWHKAEWDGSPNVLAIYCTRCGMLGYRYP